MSSYGGKELASAFRTYARTHQVRRIFQSRSTGMWRRRSVNPLRGCWCTSALPRALGGYSQEAALDDDGGSELFGDTRRFDAEEGKPRSKRYLELLRTEGEQFAAWLET